MVNVNPSYRTSELQYALNQSGIANLLIARGWKGNDFVAMVDAVRGGCSRCDAEAVESYLATLVG